MENNSRVRTSRREPVLQENLTLTATDAASPVPAPALFRQTALQRMTSPERLDMAAAIVRPTGWLLLATAAVAAVTALVATIVIHVPIKVQSDGILLTPAGVKEAVAT